MKKVHFFVLAAIAAMTAISCNKEIETPAVGTDAACPEGYYVEELTAVYPRDPETRTAFNETTGRFAWTEGDELAFHLSNGEYIAAPIDPATGKVKLYLPVGVTRDNYAVYPAASIVDDAAEIGNMKVTLPDIYDITSNLVSDFVPTPLVAWNDAENTHLKFEHVGGLLQVNLTVPAGTRTASVSLGKSITGVFDLQDGSGNGIIAPGEAEEDNVTFVLSETGLRAESGVKLLVPVPTGTYESIKLVYNDGFDDTFKFEKDLSANPWTFARSGGKKITIGESNFEDITPDYFWFEALQASCGVTVKKGLTSGLYYSIDNKKTWTAIDTDSSVSITLRKKGDRVYFYGTAGNIARPASNTGIFGGYGKLAAGGDILTLLQKTGAVMPSRAFEGLFYYDNALIDASAIILPDYTASACYYNMFYYCQNLTKTPVLPAMKVESSAYNGMFGMCRSLTVAPELPATEIGVQGYMDMFEMSGLIEAPELPCPAEGMGSGCYQYMFWNCHSLIKAADLNATAISSEACVSMYGSCDALVNPPFIAASTVALGGFYGLFKGCTKLNRLPDMPNLTKLERNACLDMFYGCTSLVDLSDAVLTATTIGEESYKNMFKNCTNLTKAPRILANSFTGMRSCVGMFEDCTSLIQAPELPSMSLGTGCYQGMFRRCTSLTQAPELPATSMKNSCYSEMFRGCTSLEAIPTLPATSMAVSCYAGMFRECTSITTAYLPATSGTKPTVGSSVGAYKEMFMDCTSLTDVELFGTPGCKSMFSGCTSLNKIITHFKVWQTAPGFSEPNQCATWVSNVAESGTFYKVADLPCTVDENNVAIEGDYTGVDFIPLGWNVVVL